MKYKIHDRNVYMTDDVREYIEKRFSVFGKFFSDETEIQVTLSRSGNLDRIEVTIPLKGTVIRAEESGRDIRTIIDKVQETVERLILKNRRKLIERHRSAPDLTPLFTDDQGGWDTEEEEEIRIVRTKHFAIKPMSPEEACFQMDISGHSFYVFRNADTDQVNVVYKRKQGDYGLIEPEE